MKILLISCVSINIYLFKMGLMKELRRIGFKVKVIAGYDRFSQRIINENFDYIRININRKGVNPFQDSILFLDLFRIIKREKPDIIVNYTSKPVIYGSLAGFLCGTKIIDVITGLGYAFIRKNFVTAIIKILYKTALKKADKIIFLNHDDLRLFAKEELVPVKKSYVIKSEGVNTDYFAPGISSRKRRSCSFLFVGRILWDKGIREYVESARIVKEKYPDSNFDIIGYFDKENPAAVPAKYIENFEKDRIIKYIGFKDDIKRSLPGYDVIVLPSYREGIPRSLLEASSMERAIITTDAPGCREVVEDHKNGLLVPVKNKEALSKAMLWMIEHQKERIRMGKYGRRKMIREFDERIIVGKYVGIIKELLYN